VHPFLTLEVNEDEVYIYRLKMSQFSEIISTRFEGQLLTERQHCHKPFVRRLSDGEDGGD
jgi:hypothetical protein